MNLMKELMMQLRAPHETLLLKIRRCQGVRHLLYVCRWRMCENKRFAMQHCLRAQYQAFDSLRQNAFREVSIEHDYLVVGLSKLIKRLLQGGRKDNAGDEIVQRLHTRCHSGNRLKSWTEMG